MLYAVHQWHYVQSLSATKLHIAGSSKLNLKHKPAMTSNDITCNEMGWQSTKPAGNIFYSKQAAASIVITQYTLNNHFELKFVRDCW